MQIALLILDPRRTRQALAETRTDGRLATFAARQRPDGPAIAYCSHEYDVASRRYFFELVSTLPADVLVRTYASARGMWDLPFRWQGAPLPGWHPWLYRARARALMLIAPFGVAAIVLAVLLIAARSPRWAACVCLFLLYFGGYPALQSDERHYFHLEFITWWAFGVLAAMAFAALRDWKRERAALSALRAVAVAVSVTAVVGLPLVAVRWYQQRELRAYFQRYIDAPKAPLPLAARSGLVEVDMDAEACGRPTSVTAVYDATNRVNDFSRAFAVDSAGASGVTRVFFPAYDHFQGIKLASANPACSASASQVADVRPFPLLMAAMLTPGWERKPLYQRFR